MTETITIAMRMDARRIAFQALYQADAYGPEFLDTPLREFAAESSEEPMVREMATRMARGAAEYMSTSDGWINRVAPKWPVARMDAVDRNILRLAVWELNDTSAPPKAVLDEAVRLAQDFGTAESGSFVNGVLDAIHKEIEKLKSVNVG